MILYEKKLAMLTNSTNPSFQVGVIATSHFFSRLVVLARSLQKYHPEAELTVLCLDDLEQLREHLPFARILCGETLLGKQAFEWLSHSYPRRELCWALKPKLLDYLVAQKPGGESFILDCDTLLYGRLDPLLESLDRASIVLTPHLVKPPVSTEQFISSRHYLSYGVYNSGIVGVRNDVEGKRFSKLWSEMVSFDSYAGWNGPFGDQHWLEHMQVFFAGKISVCLHSGVNVGFWNLHERELCFSSAGVPLVDQTDLILFHWSHWSLENPHKIGPQGYPISVSMSPELQVLADRYVETLKEVGIRPAFSRAKKIWFLKRLAIHEGKNSSRGIFEIALRELRQIALEVFVRVRRLVTS